MALECADLGHLASPERVHRNVGNIWPLDLVVGIKRESASGTISVKPGARQRPLDSDGAWRAPVEGLARGPPLLHLCHAWLNASLRIAAACSLVDVVGHIPEQQTTPPPATVGGLKNHNGKHCAKIYQCQPRR